VSIQDTANGLSFDLKEIEVSKLKIEKRYQRRPNENRWKAMARAFDLRLIGAIVVSFRDGVYYCVTGQHRMLAARHAGVATLPAVILYGLTLEDEAEIFEKNATTTKAIAPIDVHRARLASKDLAATAVDKIIRAHGHVFASGGGGRSDHLAAIRACYKLHEMAVLDDVLSVIGVAWKREDSYVDGALKGGVMRAIGEFLQRFPHADRARLADAMSRHLPVDLTYHHPGGNAEMWRLVVVWYNRNLTTNRLAA
jgi:hypothetical protein